MQEPTEKPLKDVVLPCALGLPWAMDRTASVYIARGELQRAEILLQRATQHRRTYVGAPHPGRDAQYLFCTGVLAALQGRFEEGRKILLDIVQEKGLKGHRNTWPLLGKLFLLVQSHSLLTMHHSL